MNIFTQKIRFLEINVSKFFEFSKVDKLLNEAQAERQKVLDNDSNYNNFWFP